MAPPTADDHIILERRRLDAILFDLDGVITKTASIHAAAWKQLFDAYLAKRATHRQEAWQPFDIEADYRRYVDGKPRMNGVRSFLLSRQIVLPEGQPDDPPDRETIHGLGNAKNALFLSQLEVKGIEVYDTTIALIHQAKAQGLKVAVISSSRHCADVLEAAGLMSLFDARVDGVESDRLELQGKPAPDIFLEAAGRLAVDPRRTAVVEDAIAGVQAGRAGGFALVIGIDRAHQAMALKAHGADVVVSDLMDVRFRDDVSMAGNVVTYHPVALPSALARLDAIRQQVTYRQLVIFLDYDGTLTPIVRHPEDAHLSETMRAVLRDLAMRWPVAIVSGRDLNDLRHRIALDTLYYAGSHGFEIAGPNGMHDVYGPAQRFLSDLDAAEQTLRKGLSHIAGSQVERKHFAIAIHYRRVQHGEITDLEAIVSHVQHAYSTLRQTGGKKVFELRPNLEWHKGTALFWLLDAMGLDRDQVLPIYIGDDMTDEDAFAALQAEGIGILVAVEPCQTAARYQLVDTEAVKTFLAGLAAMHRKDAQR